MDTRMNPTRNSILVRMAEHDQIGSDAFLRKYANSRPPKRHFVYNDNKLYPLKALYAAAHRPATPPMEFNTYFARKSFEKMKFECIIDDDAKIYIEGRQQWSEVERIARSRGLVRAAKLTHGVICSVCGFDFEKFYGEIGRGFIECHHINLISKTGERAVTVDEISVVCSNCHRMIHTSNPPLDISDLRVAIQTQSNGSTPTS